MVIRKPLPSEHPPYPTSPVVPDYAAAASYQDDAQEAGRIGRRSRASSTSSHNTWNSGFSDDDDDNDADKLDAFDHPAHTANGATDGAHDIPSSLRPGPPVAPQQQTNPWASEELQGQEIPARPPVQSSNPHNPYLRMQNTGQNQYDSQSAWAEPPTTAPPPPPALAPPPPPVELPTMRTPTDELSKMTLGEALETRQNTNSVLPQGLQPALVPVQTGSSSQSIERQHSGASSNPWQDDSDRKPESQEKAEAPALPICDQKLAPPPASAPPPPPADFVPPPPAAVAPVPPTAFDPPALPPPQYAQQPSQPISLMDDEPAPQPSKPIEEVPPPQPPRPAPIHVASADAAAAAASRTSGANPPETPMTRAKRQRNETYQIKQIRWYDAAVEDIRQSPVMTQNANGPCPLLALVNALSLSTPANVETALVDALRSREQVSLGFLLDAVFEELARRSEINDKELPDVGDLYAFLITLHTGMNVNPSFVLPGTPHVGSVEAEVSVEPGIAKPGVFEETREMVLYSTFDIPLLHGWIPPPGSPPYAAFARSAKTFDEALNIQFREQELEDKLETTGLTPDEQQTYEDIAVIKQFLEEYPTQLTEHGLEVMTSSLKPGSVSILFRNDHFTTLYKEPRTGVLLTLVTDAGYSSHDEIIWESLKDVSGAASELFSGDFRPVGSSGSSAAPNTSSNPTNEDASQGWQTVPSHGRGNQETGTIGHSTTYAPPPGPPPGRSTLAPASDEAAGLPLEHHKSTEQEDHDLALALQLQEEEEDNERREAAARRRREDELSRQFLDREGQNTPDRPPRTSSPPDTPENRPQVPPRRSNLATPQLREPAPSPSLDAPYLRGQEGADDQPPSYEQAASDRPFRPPGSHPRNSNRQGDALGALNAITAQQRAQNMNAGLSPTYPSRNQSSMSVNTAASGNLGQRRTSSIMNANGGTPANRVRRVQSQSTPGSVSAPIYGARPNNQAQAPPGSGVAAQEEKCTVM